MVLAGDSGSERLKSVLGRHGLGQPLADDLIDIAETLRAMTQREGVELAATLDVDTGAPVGPMLRGSGSDVDFEPHRLRLRGDGRYVSLHTHPGSTPPSHKDFLVVVSTPPVQALIVVGVDGTWYVASRDPDIAPPRDEMARATFAAAFIELRPEYLHWAQLGLMTPAEALTALLDAVWRAVAQRLGLRYDRVEGVSL